jgi:hypothetical protein
MRRHLYNHSGYHTLHVSCDVHEIKREIRSKELRS